MRDRRWRGLSIRRDGSSSALTRWCRARDRRRFEKSSCRVTIWRWTELSLLLRWSRGSMGDSLSRCLLSVMMQRQ
jgi:hypothetical protein